MSSLRKGKGRGVMFRLSFFNLHAKHWDKQASVDIKSENDHVVHTLHMYILYDLSEDDVSVVQPGGLLHGDEELGAIGVLAYALSGGSG